MLPQFQFRSLVKSVEIPRETIRVLHVVESLDKQAIESWLLRVLRTAASDYPQIKWSFFTTQVGSGEFDDTARELGAEVIHSQYELGETIRFVRSLREIMKRGQYDILHCHHDVMSALYLLASRGVCFQKRIVHVHNTSLSLPTRNRFKTNVAREPMRQMCLRMADQIVGVSKDALQSVLGGATFEPARHRVIHCAVETERLLGVRPDLARTRRELGVEESTKILLFVGRLVPYKNPFFMVDILEHMAISHPDVVAIFAGAGSQEEKVRELAKQKSLEDRIRLLGFREDVPDLMLASDILIWPSFEEPKEGLGLGIVEAQAAGLPSLISRGVPEEAIVIPELVDVLPLAEGAGAWANRVRQILMRSRPDHQKSAARIEASSFSMSAGVASLFSLYE
jgi:glycosyltransferase involved in cell wall biosynthesis